MVDILGIEKVKAELNDKFEDLYRVVVNIQFIQTKTLEVLNAILAKIESH